MTTKLLKIGKMTDKQIQAFMKGDSQFVYIGYAHKRYAGVMDLKQSKWANPHDRKLADICKARKCSIGEAMIIACEQYREDLLANPKLVAALPELKGKTLLYFFEPSHGNVLVELVEAL